MWLSLSNYSLDSSLDFYCSIDFTRCCRWSISASCRDREHNKMSFNLVFCLLVCIAYKDVSATLERLNELNEVLNSAQREIVRIQNS